MREEPGKSSDLPALPTRLLGDIRRMIEEARSAVAAMVNVGLTMLYWRIGNRIYQEILIGKRADYGAKIVSTLSRQLELEYGNGFSVQNIRHIIRFTKVFSEERIVSTLWSWAPDSPLSPNEAYHG